VFSPIHNNKLRSAINVEERSAYNVTKKTEYSNIMLRLKQGRKDLKFIVVLDQSRFWHWHHCAVAKRTFCFFF